MDRKKEGSKLLSLHRLSPTTLSSDEGAAESDDSEEDVVTDYLEGPAVQPAHVHGQTRKPLRRMAEIPTMDSLQGASPFLPPHIPTISITPHSPIAAQAKPFPNPPLEENLKMLHGIQETIQRMRTLNVSKGTRGSGSSLSRLSSSCPSLNVADEEEAEETSCKSSSGGGTPPPPEHLLCPEMKPKIRVNDTTPTGSEELLLEARQKDGSRRRSWSSCLNDDKRRPSQHAPSSRQRSISLSSLDSDGEEAFYGVEDSQGTADAIRRRRSSPATDKQRSMSGSSSPVVVVGGTSTHSLNDVIRPAISPPAGDKPRLLTPRLTLQKSVSTPSILVGVINQQQQTHKQQSSSREFDEDDGHVVAKRRKRGSIFFRKKKDKNKKSSSSSHFFTSALSPTVCDVCSKSSASMRCETCFVCVHDGSCKDQIAECSKLVKHAKVSGKPQAGISNATKSASLGSAPSRSTSAAASRSRSSVPSPTRPLSFTSPSGASPVRRLSGLSQWKRVATKLGVNKPDTRDSTADLLQDATDANILDVNSASMESLEDGAATEEPSADDIDDDPELRLLEEEDENWVRTVDKELVSRLTEKQVKKQAHLYELIYTEKKHCCVLKLMQKVFAEGMTKELGMHDAKVKRIFPCLDELVTIHCSFLWRLRQVQRINPILNTIEIGELLLDQFMGDNAQGLMDAYGVFCSQHKDAVSYYKDILRTDKRFQAFISKRSSHKLLNKMGITEAILTITHRVTKYPLMIDAIMKCSKGQLEEIEILEKASEKVKHILNNINSQVAEKERKQRLFEIYNKIDAKSSTFNGDQKFRNFEGEAELIQQRGKPILVQVIVMSDLVFFLQEANQKYYFVTPDHKSGVIPLDKLYVREKAGQDSRVLYFLHSKNQDAEMFEIECKIPKDKKIWLDSIKSVIEEWLTKAETLESSSASHLREADYEKLKQLYLILHQKDKDVARICEEKDVAIHEIIEILGSSEEELPPSPQPYQMLLSEHHLDYPASRDKQIESIQEALKLICGACSGTNLARSVSSVGEHQSEAYVSPSLPKRAETFGGFDVSSNPGTSKQQQLQASNKKKKSVISLNESSASDLEMLKARRLSGTPAARVPSQDSLLGSESLSNIVTASPTVAHIIQCLQTSLVLSHHHFSQYEALRGKVQTGVADSSGRFRHNQKLEELRNIQEQISHERALWAKDRDAEEKWIADQKAELKKLKERLEGEQQDIQQQREMLYCKLETLKAQGIILSPTFGVLNTSPHQPMHDESSGSGITQESCSGTRSSPTTIISSSRPKTEYKPRTTSLVKRDSNPSLPAHLISAANQQKIPASVKQQLPMKLAKLAGSSSSSSGSSSMSSMSSPTSSHDHKSDLSQQKPTFSPSSSGVQQILPLRLSEGAGGENPKGTKSYQRLGSPPPNELLDNPIHQRTGSSPASLQNGSFSSASPTPPMVSSPASVISPINSSTGPVPANTYPKVTAKPRAALESRLQHHEYVQVSGARPGQRIKDPDTDQDIIFF